MHIEKREDFSVEDLIFSNFANIKIKKGGEKLIKRL